MASRVSAILALCALTSASIYPLSAGPRSIKISKDGTVVSDSTETRKGKKWRDDDGTAGSMRGYKKGHGGSDTGGDTGGGDTGGGGTTDGGTSDGGGTTGGGGTTDSGDTGGSSGGSGEPELSDGGTSTSDLAPLDLSDMSLWNWSGKWHASNWENAFSTIPFRYNYVQQDQSGDTHFIFDKNGSPELKAQGGHPYSTKAYYEVDVTLPQMRSGMVVAPLWLWHDNTRDEVDFEFVADKFLQVTVHSYRSGSHRTQEHRLYGDFSGQRMKLGIETDLAAGQIEMLINGQVVHTFYNNTQAFPTGELRPVISMWVGDNVSWAEAWAGPWEGFAEGEQFVMTIHGYRFEQR